MVLKMAKTSEAAHEAEEHSVSEETWQELLGRNNWKGLVEPLDMNLRKFILRCGGFCHAANDAFTGSVSADTSAVVVLPGCCQFHGELHAVTSLSSIEKVLHIPAQMFPPSKENHVPTWMGYCAATTDQVSAAIGRREIYIAWRGTKRLFEWKNNFKVETTSASCLLRNRDGYSNVKITKGWLSIYTSTEDGNPFLKKSARDQVKDVIGKLLEKYKGEKISIVVTGHSLGAILAVLTAFDLAENLVGEEIRVAAVVFGCPRVGNSAFRERVKQHVNLSILQVKNEKDMITNLPLARRVGTELVVDSRKSAILSARNMSSHELEACLYTVAGWNGKHQRFELKVPRSIARVMTVTKSFLYIKSEVKTWFHRIGRFFGDDDSKSAMIVTKRKIRPF